MNVAVTGGAGQLGTQVLSRLLAQPRYKQIVCLDLRPPPLPLSNRLRYIPIDIRASDLARHFEGMDAIVHLAFVVTNYLPRAEYDAINVGGSRNLFNAAARAGVRQIVYSSSLAAYGVVPGHPELIVEDTPRRLQPDFPYAAAKYQIEAFLDAFEPAHPELAIARLRPSVLIGAHMEHPLGHAMRAGLLPDSGGSRMPVVWDEDVADAILLCLERKARGPFLLTAEPSLPPAEVARATGLRLLKIPAPVAQRVIHTVAAVQRMRKRPHADPAWVDGMSGVVLEASSAKARTELGWTPKAPTTLDVFRRYLDLAPRKLDRRLRLFFKLTELAVRRRGLPAEHRRMSGRIHLALAGPGGDDVGLVVEHGRLQIARTVPRPPTAVVRMEARTLLALLAGELDYSSAELTGKLRIEGEPAAGLLIGAGVAHFRAQRGYLARRLGRWFQEPRA